MNVYCAINPSLGFVVQLCVNTGLPPAQPLGKDALISLLCVSFRHVLQSVYVNEVQVGIHVCVSIGVPPVHPVGEDVRTVLVWFPLVQVLHAL